MTPPRRRAASFVAAAGTLAILTTTAGGAAATVTAARGSAAAAAKPAESGSDASQTPRTVASSTMPHSPSVRRHQPRRPYLALGDSVPFGYISGDGNAYRRPANFIGYPSYAGRWLDLRTVNAACPGEATGGFVSATDPDDNGCRAFRAQYPLHVAYTGTQLQYATGFLTRHPRTALVTIMLGANDGFRLENQCAGDLSCALNGLPALQKTISGNLTTAVRAMRATPYSGPIMIVDYYSTDYTNAEQTLLSTTLDDGLTKLAGRHHLLLADGFAAMKRAAASAGGNTCEAGLLNVSPSDPASCDVHPSQSGHRVLAGAVKRTYLAWKRRHPQA